MSRFTPPTPSFIYVGNQSRLPAIISPLNWEITFLCCNRTFVTPAFCFPYYIALRILLRIKCKHMFVDGLFVVYIGCCTGPARETAFRDMEVGSFGEYIHFSLLAKGSKRGKSKQFLDICNAGERAKIKKWLKSEKSKTVDGIVNICKVEKITCS